MAKAPATLEQVQRQYEVRNLLLTVRLGLLLRTAPLRGAIAILINAGAADAAIPIALGCSAARYWSVLNELTRPGGEIGEGSKSEA